MTQPLGRLESVKLRDIWPTEDGDFTPWLAKEENLKLLGETIGMELELEATEKNVGPFKADILCKNIYDGSWVLIENQLERTDHTHLGQLLTYGAGLDAINIVWIASKFTEEHRAALDWQNTITDEDFRFFGLEVEAWKIGESLPAPKFNIISQPNNWSKFVAHEARRISEGTTSDTEAMYYRYWQQFAQYLEDEGSTLRPHSPRAEYGQRFSFGRTGVCIAATISVREKRNGVEILLESPELKHNKALFNLLKENKEEIEDELGFPLEWEESPQIKRSKIFFYKGNVDPENEATWSNQNIWFKEILEKFDNVFRERVKNLDPNDWNPESDIE